jgi:molybdate transport system regulatory protein
MKKVSLIRFRIDFTENSNLGPGKIALLEGIRKHSSLSEAGRQMGMSYRRAWLLLDDLNKSFDTPATVNRTGGRGGGGAELTAFGILLIERYRDIERKLNEVAGERLGEISRRVNRNSASPARKVPLSRKNRKGASAAI